MKTKGIFLGFILFTVVVIGIYYSAVFLRSDSFLKEEETKSNQNLNRIKEYSDLTKTVFQEEYLLNTTKIVIQNHINPVLNALESFDESQEQNKTVMSYITLNQNDTEKEKSYTIYLQANGFIVMPENSQDFFYRLLNLEEIVGLEYLDTHEVKNMANMFSMDLNLRKLDLSHFDTSNVTDMSHMFQHMQSLESLDVSNFDTSHVTNMEGMFGDLASLVRLDVSNFDTSNVTNMGSMFSATSSLNSLDLSHFNTSKVTNMADMFHLASNLKRLDLSSFNTTKVADMSNMFSDMYHLAYLDVSSFDTSKVTNMTGMFYRIGSLTNLDLSSFDTSNVTDTSYMFSGSSLENIKYGPNFVRSNNSKIDFMYDGCFANKPTDASFDGI